MPTQEERLTTVEREIATMKQDIIYKLDDTNTAVTMLKGVIGNQGKDLREIKLQLKLIDTRVEGVKDDVRQITEHLDEQGQGIRTANQQIAEVKQDINNLHVTFEQRFTSLEGKFEQVLQQLAALTSKPE